MISWKKFIFIGLPIISLFYWGRGSFDNLESKVQEESVVNEDNQPQIKKIKQATEVHTDQVNLSQSAHKKIKPISNFKLESNQIQNEIGTDREEIPWDTIRKDWHEALKFHLSVQLGLSEEKVEQLFNQLMDEKVEFERVGKYLNAKQESFILRDENGDILDIRDERMLEETQKQLNRFHNDYVAKIKKIFGPHYASIHELCNNFSSELPYPNIYADAAFVE